MKMYMYKYFYASKSLFKKSFDIEKMLVDRDLLFKFSYGFGYLYKSTNDISWMQAELFSVRKLSKEEEKKFVEYFSKC